jgi:iodotyrosine deiodinase
LRRRRPAVHEFTKGMSMSQSAAAVYTKQEYPFVPYQPPRRPPEEVVERAQEFYRQMDTRRSVRMFSPDPVPREAIEFAIRTASTAPSGAHQQPWTWVVIGDAETKHAIREAAEAEERENYEGGRMSEEWQRALAPIGTNSQKPYLDVVPWIVVGFEQIHGYDEAGNVRKHYYAKQSMGIACGFFIAALHVMGLATLTHTPSPMAFLSRLLERPANEKPFIVFPIGYPAEDCIVPELPRKSLGEVVADPPEARAAANAR